MFSKFGKSFINCLVSKYFVNTGKSTLMPISHGLLLSILCRKTESERRLRKEIDGKVFVFRLSQYLAVSTKFLKNCMLCFLLLSVKTIMFPTKKGKNRQNKSVNTIIFAPVLVTSQKILYYLTDGNNRFGFISSYKSYIAVESVFETVHFFLLSKSGYWGRRESWQQLLATVKKNNMGTTSDEAQPFLDSRGLDY